MEICDRPGGTQFVMSEQISNPFPQGLVPVVVGVTGHRDIPDADIARLGEGVRTALLKIMQSSPHSPHIMLTSLAEGGDRIAAGIAIEMGWKVGVVLPARAELYEQDFNADGSRDEFHDLLSKAAWVETLPAGLMTPAAYRAAGVRIARQSLYLLAFWDGKETIVEGGTADIVDLFLHGIPEERMTGAADNSLLEARPVWHVRTRRQGNFNDVAEAEVGNLVLLAPEPEGIGSERELERWADVLGHIDRFNSDAAHCLASNAEAIKKARSYLDGMTDAELSVQAHLPATLYAVADAISMETQNRRKRHIKTLFAMAMCAILSEQIYSGLVDNPLLHVLAIAFGVCAWLVYVHGTRLRLENRYLDYRALAEACRVQYFWKRAGIKAGVADHFLRDQRDELEWIRRAVRTTELLPGNVVPTQVQMESVAEVWLDGQRHYFIGTQNKAKINRIKDEVWTSRAGFFFKAGIVAAIILAIFHIFFADAGTDVNTAQIIMLVYGMLFASAGLIKVHQEIEAFSEHANRYRRMGIAMAVARRRLDAALAKGDMVDAENVLLGAGRDALEESGGWLLLHRDRPVKVPLG